MEENCKWLGDQIAKLQYDLTIEEQKTTELNKLLQDALLKTQSVQKELTDEMTRISEESNTALYNAAKKYALEKEALQSETELYRTQATMYQEDFAHERKDRENLHGRLIQKEEELAKKEAELTNMKQQFEEELQTKNQQVKQYKRQVDAVKADLDKCQMELNQVAHTIPILEGLDQRLEKGRGAFGAVYEVKLNGTPCIAKGLHEILLGLGGNLQVEETDKQAIRQKFFNECVLLSKLKHPNIVQFLGVHSTKENEYLVMEYMHMDLAQCLKTYHDIPASIKVSILHDVSYGLLHLHSQDPPIIHRDLTATNVLLTPDMKAKVADLGVSKIFDLQQLQIASVQTKAPGTKAYMPPEALMPHPKYDFKLDIFSFGVLSLYTAIQEFPIEHEHQITAAVAKKKEVQIYRRKYWIEKMEVVHPLRPLVIKCLQDRLELRPTTKELCGMIESILSQHKKDWRNVLELCSQVQMLKMESDQYRKQLGPRVLHK